MKRLSEYENEEAVMLLADLIEPVAKILSVDEVRKAMQSKEKTIAEKVAIVLRTNATLVVQVLARLEGVEVKDYKGTIITMTKDLMDIANDKDMIDFFQSLGQNAEQTSSSSALESTEE